MTRHVDLYDGHYGHLGADPLAEVRKATYGDDLGQASWITPVGCNERLIEQSGFSLLTVQDATDAVASVSQRWRTARAKRREPLVALEGQEKFDGLQQLFLAVHTLARERRLSRYVYLAEKRSHE